ncbi:polysaccharide biosynthesis/export family protein [Dokdonia sp. Hel_I_53]|uniref:polysaccharide biosynthesis/export family protein n=1 Tax=Dokdonia sp. Hel_I_53 TaxID=1566287 RepID=UPI001199675E|nr:polysaccharide biosynthesis/export family protein [Dokdonia sp. Hel_I_53]TVZ53378.1 protein involved in gliding motility EpsA [Dokdonia sp. Hel_I_53]
MRYIILVLLLSMVALTSSCVPLKDITYLRESEMKSDSLISVQVQQRPYRVQVGDILSIRLKALDQQLVDFFNPAGSGGVSLDEGFYYDGFAIDTHGNIRVPELGEINVLGRTTEEIREIIEKRLLADYIKDEADLFVTVKLPGIRYTLVGEIGSPGTQNVLAEKVSILEAIANAGGVPLTGDLTDILIIRQYPGGQRVHHIDLTTIDVMQSPFYYIQPNDIITVNPLPQKAIGVGTTGLQALTTIISIVTTIATVILLATR